MSHLHHVPRLGLLGAVLLLALAPAHSQPKKRRGPTTTGLKYNEGVLAPVRLDPA